MFWNQPGGEVGVARDHRVVEAHSEYLTFTPGKAGAQQGFGQRSDDATTFLARGHLPAGGEQALGAGRASKSKSTAGPTRT